MNFTVATKKQLYKIATDDLAPLSRRYDAARELQIRRFDSDMMHDLVRMWPNHTADEIAEYLGIPVSTVVGVAQRYKLKRRKDT